MNAVMSRGYALPVMVSLALHSVLLAVLLLGWQPSTPPREIKKPNFVQAKLVKLEAQTKQAKPVEAKPKIVDLEQKRREQARLKKLEEQKKQAALKKKQEEKKRLEEQKKKAEAERKRKEEEKARQEAERKKREEQQRRDRELKAMEQALAAEQAELLETSYAQTAQSYIGAISERIERNWSRPPSARNNMSCELLIQLVPTGRVINVDVVKSSGNPQFDRSAIQAVEKAEQFPEIKDMPSEVFERYYRNLTLVFRPEDLRQ